MMALLDSLPHRVDQLRSQYTQGELAGMTRQWVVVQRAIPCWVQRISSKELVDYDARGVKVMKHVYFRTDPGVTELDLLRFVDPQTGNTLNLEVRAYEDAGVHFGGPFRAAVAIYTGDVDAPVEA